LKRTCQEDFGEGFAEVIQEIGLMESKAKDKEELNWYLSSSSST